MSPALRSISSEESLQKLHLERTTCSIVEAVEVSFNKNWDIMSNGKYGTYGTYGNEILNYEHGIQQLVGGTPGKIHGRILPVWWSGGSPASSVSGASCSATLHQVIKTAGGTAGSRDPTFASQSFEHLKDAERYQCLHIF